MESLQKQLQNAKRKFNKQVKEKVEEVAVIVGETLVEGSKVDTGLHAANYQITLDKPREDFLDYDTFGLDKLKVARGTRVISEAEAKERASKIPDFTLGKDIIWTNNVPYIHDIDGLTTIMASKDTAITKANAKVG